MIDVNKAIATTVKTGKIYFGANSALKSAKTRKVKLIIFASNCPQKTREKIEYYCKLSKIPMSIYNGDRLDLGAVCGKPFEVSALSVREPGESNILKIAEAYHG
jgi:large subunit ribosomal protein L30e